MRFFDQFKKGESVLDLGYLAYSRILGLDELSKLKEYFSTKDLSKYVFFNGNSFFISDQFGNLSQSNKIHQPIYCGEGSND